MTGYGRGESSAGGVKVVVELSSVNRRQFDMQLYIPKSLHVLEPRIHELIHEAISRGRIKGDISVTRSDRTRGSTMTVDEDLARSYARVLRKASRELDLRDDLSSSLLLSLPDVVRYQQATDDPEALWPVVGKALKRALKAFLDMRKHEGAALQADLEHRLGLLEGLCGRIRARAPCVVARYRDALLARLGEAGLIIERADERIMKDIVLFADRSDITEELTRLDSHIAQTRRLMRSKEAVGKSMDFMAQEMFREINTIGSKANDATILQQVVAFKTELERLREQVQNIE